MAITTGSNITDVTEDGMEVAIKAFVARGGRPSSFTEALGAEICARLAAGESLSRICRDEGMPHRVTVNDWTRKLKQFGISVARARGESGSALADSARDILDDLNVPQFAIDPLTGKSVLIPTSLTSVRIGEVRARMALEQAKCYDRDTFGDQRMVKGQVSVEHTIGGIIDLVMGKTKSLVHDAEYEDVRQIEG